MTEEQIRELITNITNNITDQAIISQNLLQLQKGITEIFTENTQLTKDVKTLTENNEALRKVNMDYMLELGSSSSKTDVDEPELDEPEKEDNENDTEGIKISDLFGEDGRLK